MKKLHPMLSMCVALSFGAAVVSCNSFSSGGGETGTGGSGVNTGTGGSSDTSGSGGDTSTGSGGDVSTGSGGDTSTGSGGDTGSGGSVVTGTGGTSSTGTGGAKGGSTGTGGTSSTGTGGAKGGTTGTGGTPATGGTPGTGGAKGGSTGTGGTPATGGTTGTGGSPPVTTACDILNAAGNNCVAAHSTVRVLYPGYTGALYQVCKGSSVAGPKSCTGTTMDIGSISGGFANGAAQDSFCSGGTCTISIIYDQTPNHNDLKPAPAGGAKASADNPVNATDLKTTLNGHEAYGIWIKSGMGYRAGCTGCGVVTPKGTATGDQPETEYLVTSANGPPSKTSGKADGCCFDYGNAETDAHDDGNGTMEAVYFGDGVVWGTGSPGGHGSSSWVMADLENGLYAGWSSSTQDQNISTNTPLTTNYITAVLVGDSCTGHTGCAGTGSAYPNGRFALYGGDATTGNLKTEYDGVRPAKAGYVPMAKQGSIILGIGGDNSDSDGGQWFEGVMASGAATVATLNSLQANIVSAGYGK